MVIYDGTRIGRRCIIHAGVVIGSDGYGFAMHEGKHHKIPQIGIVRIEDDVEIGAGTTIDRAALGETVIGEGTKIDNLVQIGHNVKIGKHCLLVSQVGIAGSTELGDHVFVAGQSGFSGHLKIGHRVQVAAKSAVLEDVPDDTKVMGSPAMPFKEFARRQAALKRLARKKAPVAARFASSSRRTRQICATQHQCFDGPAIVFIADPGEIFLHLEKIVRAALDNFQEIIHRRHFLELLGQEPLEKIDRDVVVFRRAPVRPAR